MKCAVLVNGDKNTSPRLQMGYFGATYLNRKESFPSVVQNDKEPPKAATTNPFQVHIHDTVALFGIERTKELLSTRGRVLSLHVNRGPV